MPENYAILLNDLKNKIQTTRLGLASVGGTRNALTKGMIEDFEINLPPLPTQTSIAATLASIRDALLPKLMNGEIAV